LEKTHSEKIEVNQYRLVWKKRRKGEKRLKKPPKNWPAN